MLDIKFIRENKEIVEAAVKSKNRTLNVNELLAVYDKKKALMQKLEENNRERNVAAQNRDSVKGIELKKQVDFITRTYKQPALVEEFISGQEFTVAIVGNENPEIMPVVQIKIDGKLKFANVGRCSYGKNAWLAVGI